MSVFARLFAKPSTEADPYIDRMVAASDKRLAYVKGYREKLRAPVTEALAALRDAIARIPGPVEVGAGAWSQDDALRPLFAKADEAAAAFSSDEGVRDFFTAQPAGDCYGMLALELAQRRVLASALQGEMLQAEVARTTVSFSKAQVLIPCPDESAVREGLLARAFEYLALCGLQRVGESRADRQALEQERALLQARLRLASRKGAGFGGLGASTGTGAGSDDPAALQRDLERIEGELEQAASRQLLPELIEDMAAVLAKRDEYLLIEPCTLSLDAMNFVTEPSEHSITPRVAMLTLAGRGTFGVLVARFPRTELRAAPSLADAMKYL
jgi:hypothetical protein